VHKTTRDTITTKRFRDTLRRFGIIKGPKSYKEIMDDMVEMTLPVYLERHLFVSPKQMEDFKGLSELGKEDNDGRCRNTFK
jgi:hypothetical protein